MLAYNHEEFIEQAIESALMQEVNFEYEIVIGEDCSVDRTREIVMDFQQRHSSKIRIILSENNVGMNRNLAQTMSACKGKYIAILEGDDYWTNPHKLQEQADFLDSHPECSNSFHDVAALYEDGQQEIWTHPKEFSTIEDILLTNFISTCSVMIRNGAFGAFPSWFYTLKWADWPLHILTAQKGSIGHIPKVMAVYRIHSKGFWSRLSSIQRLQEVIEFYRSMDAHLEFKYHGLIEAAIAERQSRLAVEYEKVDE